MKIEKKAKEFSSLRLICQVQAGDAMACQQIHDRFRTRLIQLIGRRIYPGLRSKVGVEDVFQDAFQVLFERIKRGDVQLEKKGDLWRYLAGISRNRVRKAVERFSGMKRSLAREEPLAGQGGDRLGFFSQHEDLIELADTLERVVIGEKPLVKRVLLLRLAGCEISEIGFNIGRSKRTVARILYRCRSKLDEILGTTAPTGSIEKQRTINGRDLVLLRMIGEGGFARVYRAILWSNNREQEVAVKILKKKWWEVHRVREMFEYEKNLAANCRYPFLPVFHGAGCHRKERAPFLVMELLSSVSEKIHEQGNSILLWANQLIGAVQQLHDENLLHGDLKLDNLGIDKESNLKLLDFGLSHRFLDSDKRTEPTHLVEWHNQKCEELVSLGRIVRRIVVAGDKKGMEWDRVLRFANSCVSQPERINKSDFRSILRQ